MVLLILQQLRCFHQGSRFGRRIMSDDITALLTGFGKFKLNRRRLSVICDEDDGSDDGKSRTSSDLTNSLRNVIDFKKRGTQNVSGVVLEKSVKELCTIYNDVELAEKFKFLENLSINHGVDRAYVNLAASSLLCCPDQNENRLKLEDELRCSLVPDYHWIFLQIGRLENGVKFLVDLRSDIIELSRLKKSDDLKSMNENLKELISLWFSIGFLQLERITWKSSNDMLQKISEYEAVHPMRNWTDLKRRVGPYRRCFVFTHGSMPTEPMVVLHTALTQSIPSKIATIVKAAQSMMSVDGSSDVDNTIEDSNLCDTAIFYSITSTQKGLLGIELGNFLIKRVVKELQSEFPKMNRYSSLSPIPGFKPWLLTYIKKQNKIFTEEEEDDLKKFWNLTNADDVRASFAHSIEVNQFLNDENLINKYEKILMRLCAHYLAEVKRNDYAYDPVAHFHLKNGAVMWRINWLADLSAKGLNQSCGMMVNYRYFLEDCDKNSEKYVEDQVLAASDSVKQLLVK